ncbi:MAG: DUF72 domain-containing protein [Actinomycetota bacterium]
MSILVGTSSWTDPTLLKSGWYPSEVSTAEKRLVFYAQRFPVVEVDSTYYGMPSERNAALWAERTPAHFTFDIKAFALLTHHPANVRGLPLDLRDGIPEGKSRVYMKDLPAAAVEEVWDRFRRALMPLHSAGKLGAVFFQFPEWFVPSNDNLDYLETLPGRLPDYRIGVEFRRRTWLEPVERAERTLARLEELGMTYVCVDMPQGFDSSLPPVAAVTNDRLAVVRFHGRNTTNWKRKGITTAERFDYLYSKEQLQNWTPRLEALAKQAREVHVLFNNCYGDKAVRNATQLAGLVAQDE